MSNKVHKRNAAEQNGKNGKQPTYSEKTRNISFYQMQKCGAAISAVSLVFVLLIFIMKHIFLKEVTLLFCLGIGLMYIGYVQLRSFAPDVIEKDKADSKSILPPLLSAIATIVIGTIITMTINSIY